VLAGGGPLLEDMRALTASLGLEQRVQLPGTLASDELRRALEGATIACLPSTSEGMPGALMEAMATGVAVVATDVGGTNELVVDEESGLLVPAYDPAALAGAIGALLGDADLRARVVAGGRARMERCFSLDVMLEAKQRLFAGAASGRRGAAT
jgi:glycosyltransferase involved in cell wall biosynthesis